MIPAKNARAILTTVEVYTGNIKSRPANWIFSAVGHIGATACTPPQSGHVPRYVSRINVVLHPWHTVSIGPREIF
jgi:hypothetical protein